MSTVSEKITAGKLKRSLKLTAGWFRDSGIMDSRWGIAERILLTEGNSATEKVYTAFPAWTEHRGYSIIEQRRADCNMEAAFMYLLMADVLDSPAYRTQAGNLLEFLYCRSGLLVRPNARPENMPGVWNWSHIKHSACLWLDDNSWMCALQLMIARMEPEWDQKYGMTGWALKLADLLAEGFFKQFPLPYAPEFIWSGKINMPHWGSLTVMALARAYRENPDKRFRKVADTYHRFLLENLDQFTTSEYGYAVIGAAMAHHVYGDRLSLKTAETFADLLVAKMDPASGNIPSEHFEAPSGPHLVDTIYTVNWAVLALQCMADIGKQEKYRECTDKLLALLLAIQDTSPEKHLHGCWRGMFDLQENFWGGGDRYEGGANSIYSGWTNAPIAWAMAGKLKQKSFIQY